MGGGCRLRPVQFRRPALKLRKMPANRMPLNPADHVPARGRTLSQTPTLQPPPTPAPSPRGGGATEMEQTFRVNRPVDPSGEARNPGGKVKPIDDREGSIPGATLRANSTLSLPDSPRPIRVPSGPPLTSRPICAPVRGRRVFDRLESGRQAPSSPLNTVVTAGVRDYRKFAAAGVRRTRPGTLHDGPGTRTRSAPRSA